MQVELRNNAHVEAWSSGQDSPSWSDQGFGLWLARKLVEKIGGEVGLKDGGGTFFFRVPFEREVASPDGPDGVGPGPGVGLGDFIMKPSVLIVDALSPLRAMLRKYVEAWGFRARDVDSLQEAREERSTGDTKGRFDVSRRIGPKLAGPIEAPKASRCHGVDSDRTVDRDQRGCCISGAEHPLLPPRSPDTRCHEEAVERRAKEDSGA